MPHTDQPDRPAIAYSYLRFSHPDQATGDSVRRQTALRDAWLARYPRVTLDTSLRMEDRGRSGFKRLNPDRYALTAFLKKVEAGDVPMGSYLLIENLDRLSREEEVPATHLLTSILMAGIKVVQLSPSELLLTDKSDGFTVMRAVMELSRGHGESVLKSERVGAAWGERKRRAREGKEPASKRCPAWLEVVGQRKEGRHVVGGEYRVIPGRAAVVRQIFRWAVEGLGLWQIVGRLTVGGVSPWGRGESWSKAYVHKILTGGDAGRTALGEYQPRKGGKPDGPPVKDYYPAVLVKEDGSPDEDLWDRAQGDLARRKDRQGRVGKKVANLFTGLLWDARTRGKLLIAWQTQGSGAKRRKARVLVAADALDGRAPSVSFPYWYFEEAVLKKLQEVKVSDVLGEEPRSESADLAEELRRVEARLAEVEGELTAGEGEGRALTRVLKALDDKREELLRRHAEARQREANPRGEAWREAKTLLAAAEDVSCRLRLRSLLRAVVEDVWVLVVVRGSRRFAAVQMNFVGGARRDFLVYVKAAGYRREGERDVKSALWEDGEGAPLDFRKPADVRKVEALLLSLDLNGEGGGK